MSKGKFAPGKRVLLLSSPDTCEQARPFVGSLQILGNLCPVFAGHWDMNPTLICSDGVQLAWREKYLLIIDPDETNEQSIEAMRLLTSSPNKQEQKA